MHTQKVGISLVVAMRVCVHACVRVFLYLQTGKVMAWSFFPLNSFFSTRASTTSCLASKRFTPLKGYKDSHNDTSRDEDTSNLLPLSLSIGPIGFYKALDVVDCNLRQLTYPDGSYLYNTSHSNTVSR